MIDDLERIKSNLTEKLNKADEFIRGELEVHCSKNDIEGRVAHEKKKAEANWKKLQEVTKELKELKKSMKD